MSLAIPTKFPATIELPEGFSVVFMTSGTYASVFLQEGGRTLAYDSETSASSAYLALLASEELDDARLPAAVALALRDLAHHAVDMVCERLSGEPLSSAVFAETCPACACPKHETIAATTCLNSLCPEYLSGAVVVAPASVEGFQYCPDCGFVLAKCGDGSFLCDNCQIQKSYAEEVAPAPVCECGDPDCIKGQGSFTP